ncbi:MAG: hypothetical protein IT422_07805 [Pirellulaceae bacterium]|nr:hypothetical protein [Pirellulaceae bacterium]
MNSPKWSVSNVSRRSLPVPFYSLVACLAVILAFAPGCSEDTSIRTYRVAKKETQRTTAAPHIGSTTAPVKEQLMLAAIVPNKDFAWFFKLTGDPEVVLKSDPEFRSIVKSVAFDGSGQPTWKLHEGWQQHITPNDITYGKLTNREAGLTATVTRLGVEKQSDSEESWREYIVGNVNRWRKQLSLDEQEWAQISSELEEFPELSQGPAKAYFVSIAGKGSGGMSAPFMNRGAGVKAGEVPSSKSVVAGSEGEPVAAEKGDTKGKEDVEGREGESADSDAERRATLPITYTVPEGWRETAASGMRMAAFTIEEGELTGEVTVIAAGGGIEANIGIWLGQVGVEAGAETTQHILAAAEELTVDGVTAKLYTIDGATTPVGEAKTEETAEGESGGEVNQADKPVEKSAVATAHAASDAAQTILIVDIPWRDQQSLFVKYKGAQSLAQSQREAFVEFTKSIEWN